ncbi:cytochrome b [Pacificimonas sp. ICDLI1SI03]|jgi:ubiquinol-cytochrome c reductase cytochrome b subunit|tara:strand:+ start:43977 stop:45302 length:1326 start_codon:yes stop_codon:yes gene_type:complete
MSFGWSKPYEPKSDFGKWMDARLPLPRLVYGSVGGGYEVPKNINYFYNFGVLSGLALLIQIVTGIVLAMHYAANTEVAFSSVEHIMRNVNYGWLMRYMHANGASFFFIVVYLHMWRGLYYGSYKAPREMVWMLGVVIFLLMMATAFMGYVLPWGQMSFWGATVITNLFSAIPIVGDTLVTFLLGGFAVDNATLNRFFSLHFLLPFVIAGVVILKIWSLHIPGSNNPTGVEVKGPADTIPFHPYFTAKDLFGVGVYLIAFSIFLFFMPNFLGHPDNYIEANALATPEHIVPEWYFWPFYAILRAFTFDFILPAKLWGVIAMGAAIVLLFFLPWLDSSPVKSMRYRPKARMWTWVLAADIIVLSWCGGAVAEQPYIIISQIASMYYFAHFLIILPLVSRTETPLPLPASISEAVLKGKESTGAPAGQPDSGPAPVAPEAQPAE